MQNPLTLFTISELDVLIKSLNNFNCQSDDDPLKNGRVLRGKPIYLSKKLEFLVNNKNIKYLFLALPKMQSSKRNQIIKKVN